MIILYILILVVVLLAVLIVRQVKTYNKANSIYFKDGTKEKLYKIYDTQLNQFTIFYKEHNISCAYGSVYVIECGSQENQTLVMFHAASVGSVSWKENVEALSKRYHLYLIDTLGEGNKSELFDVEIYPKTSREVADLYKGVLAKLGVKKASIVGASYGGFICLNFAYHYSEYINKMVLIGSMGIARSVPKVVLKLTLYSFFPYKMFRKSMTEWALGKSSNLKPALNYFSVVLEGVLGRYYAPKTVPRDMLLKIEAHTLMILGNNDNLVGNPQKAIEYTSCIKNIKAVVCESGHLINMEQSAKVNESIISFIG